MSKKSKVVSQTKSIVEVATDHAPATKRLIQKFAKAHNAVTQTFCKALQFAKEAGEALLRIQKTTKLKGEALFAYVREQGDVTVSDRSFYLYQRIASRWDKLQIIAGETLADMSLSQAIKLLQTAKDKPKSPNGKDKPKGTSDTAPIASESGVPDANGEAASKEVETEPEKAIKVALPFDQPQKDRLAAMYTENGQASMPIQLMTNLIIPNLKRVSEVAISENEVPFLADALNEAMKLIEVLKSKYLIK